MPIETEVAGLTVATNSLLSAVISSKYVLDTAVSSSINSASTAATAATQASMHANSAFAASAKASAQALQAETQAIQAATAATAAATTLISAVTQRPAITPSLSVDWTKKPTAAALTAAGWTVSRAGEMTYFGAVPTKVAENLFVRSADFANASWVKISLVAPAAVTDESGLAGFTLTASATSGPHGWYQSATGLNLGSQTYRVRFLLKAAGYTKAIVGDAASGRAAACFDLVAGTILNTGSGATAALPGGASGSAGGGYISSSITPHELGGGLYWCELVMTSSTAGAGWTPTVGGYPDSGATLGIYGAQYTGDGTSGIEVYAAQLQHNFDGDYVPTTDVPITQYASPLLTAAANELAYQHNSRGECVGLLQYPADTNLILQSQNLGTAWFGTGIAVAVSKRLWAGSAPFWRIAKTDTVSSRAIGQAPTLSIAAGTRYTASIALLGDRWSSTTSAQVGVFGVDNTLWGSAVDSTAAIISGPGILTQSGGSLFTISGLSYDTPTLVRITRNYPLAETRTGVYIYPAGSLSTTLGAAILATRVHLSASPSYMPYIPTTTAAVTRGAQSITLSGSAFTAVNNPVEGTLLARASVEDLVFDSPRAVLATNFSSNPGNNQNLLAVINPSGASYSATLAAGATSAFITSTTNYGLTPATSAYSYATNNFQLAVGGAVSALDTTGTVPAVNRLTVTGLNGLYQRTELYPRAMTSAELAAITTPGVLI